MTQQQTEGKRGVGGQAIYNWLSPTPLSSPLLPPAVYWTKPLRNSPSLPAAAVGSWLVPAGRCCIMPLPPPSSTTPTPTSTENKHNRQPQGVFFITRSETVFGNFSSFSLKQVQTRTTRSKVQFKLFCFFGGGVLFSSSFFLFFCSSKCFDCCRYIQLFRRWRRKRGPT